VGANPELVHGILRKVGHGDGGIGISRVLPDSGSGRPSKHAGIS